MFSMFGQTGASTKGAHTKGAANFDVRKNGQLRETRVMSKKGRQIFTKNRVCLPVEGPHIFSERDPAESKSGPENNNKK